MSADRYGRQVLFPPIQEKGQERIREANVLVVGCGALGTVICNHLVRAGIGGLRIIDRDYVEASNLQRQMLFDENDVEESMPKAVAAKNKLNAINSSVQIEAIIGNVTNENIEELMDGMDIVMDGTDNFSTRFLLNDACFRQHIPYSYGGVVGSRGMNAFFIPGTTPCMRCIMDEQAGSGETCDTAGVISPAVDMVSSLQVGESLKYITGNENHLRHSLYTFDLWFNQNYGIKFAKPHPRCDTCQKEIYPALTKNTQSLETVMCGRNTVQIHHVSKLDLSYWENRLDRIASVKRTPFLLKAEFQDYMNMVIFPDGRVLIQGTEDTVEARTVYDRYIGT